MKSIFFQISEFIKYKVNAVNAHGLHSPFLFELYNHVIIAQNPKELIKLKALRKKLLILSGNITYQDPKTGNKREVDLKKFGIRSASSHKFSYFLYKLINYLHYDSILETGTCTGVNAGYLSQTNAKEIWSIEGAKELAQAATQNLHKHQIDNINIIVGNVWNEFPKILEHANPELVFLDADHRSETIAFYLDAIKSHVPEIKCIVIHDIHWSKDMLGAWNKAIANQTYNLTIDLYQAGIIFPNHPIEKQHFVVKF